MKRTDCRWQRPCRSRFPAIGDFLRLDIRFLASRLPRLRRSRVSSQRPMALGLSSLEQARFPLRRSLQTKARTARREISPFPAPYQSRDVSAFIFRWYHFLFWPSESRRRTVRDIPGHRGAPSGAGTAEIPLNPVAKASITLGFRFMRVWNSLVARLKGMPSRPDDKIGADALGFGDWRPWEKRTSKCPS